MSVIKIPGLVRICPNPKGNPRCRKQLGYSRYASYKKACDKNSVCYSCMKFHGIIFQDSDYIRNCPNPKNNPKCRRTIKYKNVRVKRNAESCALVCISCVNYARYDNGICLKSSLPKQLSVKRYFRLCPNHDRDNPNCWLILGYAFEWRMWNAEEKQSVCISCYKRGKNQGESNPFYGRKHDSETRRRMSANADRSKEVRIKISDGVIKAYKEGRLDPSKPKYQYWRTL